MRRYDYVPSIETINVDNDTVHLAVASPYSLHATKDTFAYRTDVMAVGGVQILEVGFENGILFFEQQIRQVVDDTGTKLRANVHQCPALLATRCRQRFHLQWSIRMGL